MLREAKRILSPLGERKDLFHERAPLNIGEPTPPRAFERSPLCLPERRELRLPSVNMSARIFHSRRDGGTPLSRHFRVRYIALRYFYAGYLA